MHDVSPGVENTEKLLLAKNDKRVLNAVISEYMPFIKKCVSGVFFNKQRRNDALTDAMLAFVQSVQTYNPGNGFSHFFGYAKTIIRNRLIDAARQELAVQKPLFSISRTVDEEDIQWEQDAAHRTYNALAEQTNLRLEIEEIDTIFAQCGFAWETLAARCPKQERSRRACHDAVRAALGDDELVADMLRTRKLPIKRLAAVGISEKVLEKYRQYIIGVILILKGDYPYLHAFLPHFFDQEGVL